MVAERAGYTVTMFLIDVSKSMGKTRTVDLPDGPNGESRSVEMTNLEWSLQYVLLKIQEMIFHGRKTEQCGVILFGTEETNNVINQENGGYDHVSEYIEIAQPNANTLAKLQKLQPSEDIAGDPIDAIIVGIETQDRYLEKKKTWTRKMVVLTDGESPIVLEDWELTAKKIKSLGIITTIIGIDFDDEDFEYEEEDKSRHKRINESFYKDFVSHLGQLGVVGTCAYALQECVRPEVKVVKSALATTILRLGDVEVRSGEAIEIHIRTSKCTAQIRPASMKKFAKRITDGEAEASQRTDGDGDVTMNEGDEKRDLYAQLKMETEYFIDRKDDDEDEPEDKKEGNEDEDETDYSEKVDKDSLVRGFKYGATYVACPEEGQFPRQESAKGMDICGFFPLSEFRRDFAMGEVYYVWADASSGEQQIVFSSLVQGMLSREAAAITRWVSRDGMDPKMGVLIPREFEKVDCCLWVQMPFADDVRKYTFPSLTDLVSKKGEKITEHPFIPTKEQEDAMDSFVDSMDLMQVEKDENGDRLPWFDPRLSYNPAVHRIKQALFHAAIVTDLRTHPLPEPHPEVVKYLNPPKKVLKRAQHAIEEAKAKFKVKQVPKKVVRARKDGHVLADDDEDAPLLLDILPAKSTSRNGSQAQVRTQVSESPARSATLVDSQIIEKPKPKPKPAEDSETEDESEDEAEASNVRASSPPESTAASGLHDDDEELPQGLKKSQRIIGLSTPLADFKKNIKKGDIVSKAVEDFAWAIMEILLKPFASRRHSELLDCMRELRSTCLNEDEIKVWNGFIGDLKTSCLSKSGASNKPFWKAVQGLGREISLISEVEAERLGGTSEVTEEEAVKFIE